MVPLLRNHLITPVSVRFPFCFVVTTPQNRVFNNAPEYYKYWEDVVITPQNGVFNNSTDSLYVSKLRCDNPSKWGLQQHTSWYSRYTSGCDNPSKWGLQQPNANYGAVLNSCDNPSKWGLQQQTICV